MSLLAKIESDFLTAYKSKNAELVAVLRLLKTAIKNKQVELLRPLTDAEVLDLIIKEGKQRQDSIEQFRNAKREDLASKEEREQKLLMEYLPPALTQEELKAAVERLIKELGAKGPKDMGRVMQAIMNEYKGRVDGKVVNVLVRSCLSE